MEKFRVIVAGGRNFNEYYNAKRLLDIVLANKISSRKIEIVCGMARGADMIGYKYAEEKGYKINKFPANWDTYGKSAGYKRNVEMANNADALVAFWDGISKGTSHMIDIAKNKKLPIIIINYMTGEVCVDNLQIL